MSWRPYFAKAAQQLGHNDVHLLHDPKARTCFIEQLVRSEDLPVFHYQALNVSPVGRDTCEGPPGWVRGSLATVEVWSAERLGTSEMTLQLISREERATTCTEISGS